MKITGVHLPGNNSLQFIPPILFPSRLFLAASAWTIFLAHHVLTIIPFLCVYTSARTGKGRILTDTTTRINIFCACMRILQYTLRITLSPVAWILLLYVFFLQLILDMHIYVYLLQNGGITQIMYVSFINLYNQSPFFKSTNWILRRFSIVYISYTFVAAKLKKSGRKIFSTMWLQN